MKQLFPIVLICLAFGCTNINKRNSVSVKQPPTTTVKGKYVEGGVLRLMLMFTIMRPIATLSIWDTSILKNNWIRYTERVPISQKTRIHVVVELPICTMKRVSE